MTIRTTIRNTASTMLRNWRLLGVVGVVVVLVVSGGPGMSVVRTIALGMVATGVALNLFVLLANGGRMPAQTDSIPTEQSDDYQVLNAETRFAYLGDWIQVRGWLISPGDICLCIGVAVALGERLIGRYFVSFHAGERTKPRTGAINKRGNRNQSLAYEPGCGSRSPAA